MHADSVLLGNSSHSDPETGMTTIPPLFKVGAVAHPTLVSKSDMAAIRSPVSLACVEDDPVFPDDVREAGVQSLKANGVEHEVKVYEGVPHGFAVVGEYQDERVEGKQKEAFQQILAWLQNH